MPILSVFEQRKTPEKHKITAPEKQSRDLADGLSGASVLKSKFDRKIFNSRRQRLF